MSLRPLRRRKAACDDERLAVRYYAREAGLDVALKLTEALRAAYRSIEERSGAGSSRWSVELKIANLRSQAVGGFPYRIFYLEYHDRIEVVRVLHARSDIPAALSFEN